jgi:hypothetical protein
MPNLKSFNYTDSISLTIEESQYYLILKKKSNSIIFIFRALYKTVTRNAYLNRLM